MTDHRGAFLGVLGKDTVGLQEDPVSLFGDLMGVLKFRVRGYLQRSHHFRDNTMVSHAMLAYR